MKLLSYIFPQVLERVQSPINGEIKVIEFFGKNILYVDYAQQSGGTITTMWQETIDNLEGRISKVRSCLMLGVGGGDLIKIIKKNWPEAKITGIELDSKMVYLGKKYFHLSRYSGIKIIIADALSWLEESKNKYSFDLIFVDLFIGKENPKRSRTIVFLKNLKKLLHRQSIIVFNSHFEKTKKDEFLKFKKECKKIFTKVEVAVKYPYSRIVFLS